MALREKLEIGQVWEESESEDEWTITRFEDDDPLVSYVYGLLNGQMEEILGSCIKDENGGYLTYDWDDNWRVIRRVNSADTSQELLPDFKDTLSFFKSVPRGNCPCNILRSQCQYHNGS